MTGIEKITARIQADAQQEIDAVLAEANSQMCIRDREKVAYEVSGILVERVVSEKSLKKG